jgi:hypothetical protein
MVYVDYVNFLGENISIIKKSKEAILLTIKEVGLEVTVEKT